MRSVAIRFGVLDRPIESHKSHNSPIPYLGGVAIVNYSDFHYLFNVVD